jgi:hypothetical protein
MVAAGIFLSRVAGLVRQRVFAHYFATSDAADAFSAGFRIPNLLQNLFGEGALSASFIPVYAGLRARQEDAEAPGGEHQEAGTGKDDPDQPDGELAFFTGEPRSDQVDQPG